MARRRGSPTVTKKHLARAERERLLTRYITIVTVAVLVLVIGLVGYGFIDESLIRPKQPIAFINDESLTTDVFQTRVRYQRRQLISQYLNTLQTAQQLGGDQSLISFFTDSLSQIELQLENTSFLGRDVLDTLIDEALIRQEAATLGISVSEIEIDKAIEEAFGFFPEGTPTPTSSPVPQPTSTLSAQQLELVSPTPPPVERPTSTPDPDSPSTVEPTPSEDTEPTPTPVPTIEPTPYTRALFEANVRQAIDNLSSEIDFTEADLRDLIAAELYRQKVFEEVTSDLSREQEQVWARHILVEDEETALEVISRLESGEDWSNLAAELSTDTSNNTRGGDLGWFGTGRMVAPFETAAFALEIGEISEPVQTDFGWHVIQVLGHEIRPLATNEFDQLQRQAFETWLTNTRTNADVEILDIWVERIPDDPSIPPQLSAAALQLQSQNQPVVPTEVFPVTVEPPTEESQ